MINEYKLHSFFLDNNAVVNRISRYMRANIALISRYSSIASKKFDYTILQNSEYPLDPSLLTKMYSYLQEYKAFKKSQRDKITGIFNNLDMFVYYLRKQCELNISNNDSELANYAIEVTYGNEVSMVEFAWRMFPDGIIHNTIINSSGILRMPVQDDFGEIEYKFKLRSILQDPSIIRH